MIMTSILGTVHWTKSDLPRLIAWNRIRFDAGEPSLWACAQCDGELYRPTPCGCCGSPGCSLRCGCKGLYEDYWCFKCDRAHANPCVGATEFDAETECIVCGSRWAADESGWCASCAAQHERETNQ